MSKRNRSTITDYAVVALCPSLIVLLLASLVYFVILCAYHGQYASRLGYIWFMFILGAVGIARISIEQSRGYATGYAAVLGLATLVVLSRFQTLAGPAASLAPVVNALLIAIVWFLADRITFDCTLIDDDKDASGQGLLDGLSSSSDDAAREPALDGGSSSKGRRRRGRQPGRSVLWLTAAALPLFGIGQFLLRSDSRLQSAAMFALAIYLFAALSLLVATSFLGVRRYLRQRGVDMPPNVSAAWLGGGVAMTAAILLLCFALPQPGRVIASLELPASLKSPEWLSPSRYGWGSETAEPRDVAEGSRSAAGDRQEPGSQGQDGSEPSSSGQSSEGEQSAGEKSAGEKSAGEKSAGEKSAGEKSAGEKSGGEKSSGEKSAGEKSSGEKSAGEKSAGEKSAGEKSAGEKSAGEKSAGEPQSSESETTSDSDASQRQESPSSDQAAEASEPAQSAAQSPASSSPLSQWVPSLGWLFKVVLYLILLAILAAFLWVHRAAVADFWQRLLAWLAGTRPEQASGGDGEHVAQIEPAAARPFASFSNPLLSGADPRRAVIETFQATEAWYRERGQPRRIDETPQEYSLRLKTTDPGGRGALARLTAAYNRIVYGGGGADRRDLQTVQEVWQSFSLKEPLRS